MILIADGGSTKTSWCLLHQDGRRVSFDTEGYNPFFVNTSYILNSLLRSMPKDLPLESVMAVHYYGTGVHNEEKAAVVLAAIRAVFQRAEVFVSHDLLGAARALLGNEPGFAAILGTGTNSCIYDGTNITQQVSSCGYILGDEGSGSYIGKRVLRDYIRGLMPASMQAQFWEVYQLSPDEVMDEVYTKPLANRFCGRFSEFLYHHLDTPYSKRVIDDAFDDLFLNIVTQYADYQNYSFNCVGSVASFFREQLEQKVLQYGMSLGNIIKSPIESLTSYHWKKAN